MITRISKIARLPVEIREQLNRRLHNGELGRPILKWLNHLPETKEVLADLFAGKNITPQNLSEWRRGGYQDWLLHQQRLEWFDHLTEQETDTEKHDRCVDSHEALGSLFLFEIGQALAAAQHIKNPHDRWDRIQNLTREFARLQNAFNWSCRVRLEWSKFNDGREDEESAEPEDDETIEAQEVRDIPENRDLTVAEGDRARLERSEARPRGSLLREESPEIIIPNHAAAADLGAPASRPPESPEPPEPTPIPEPDLEPEMQPSFQPIPTLSPTPAPENPPLPLFLPPQTPHPQTPQPRPHHPRLPLRGRRFVCVEG